MFSRDKETRLVICFITLLYTANSNAAEWLVESKLDARVEYDSNLFLVPNPEDGVWSLKVTPFMRALAREANWRANLDVKLRSNTYSDEAVDSLDRIFLLSAQYQSERNVYSVDGEYSLISNLNRESPDFSISTREVQRKTIYITPAYTRLFTERLQFYADYNHTDVDFIDAEGTGYRPYVTDRLSGSLIYNLSERDKVTFTLQAIDYSTKDESLEYQLFVTRVGIEHDFTELWSVDFTIGGSRRNSTNTITQTVDFLGQPIILTEVSDFTDKSYVLNAGFNRKMETGSFSGRINRENQANSFGGLNDVSTLQLIYNQKVSGRLQYDVQAKYEDIDAVSEVTRSTDREVLFFGTGLFYTIDRHWTAKASYQYVQRKFKSDTSDDRAPHSNKVYVGMTYNFPDISTY